ncbi:MULTISPECIES: tRNA pseudouridine(38-40) synthase TruA [Thermodesulfobacterium]|jgi:tRNA pseudouridine38-40 synthase|uniref:tRNA pseudouridine synthase A n=2 Tax=Thermodesulfobacterium commune TaxID=1741 RepID=A0A075WTR7_9BACT|nr:MULTISPECIES: tRNA pseudouridine(38-40) synthase TruA [Thermodesulfobacterium]KUJ97669.1 MAG: tRNA pseudouridine synthase A [Thermodesulfobacterium sp. 37_54]KUK19441.1 MAG: tRNA pseudouridine synthase A [Thermodesulfobacterium commune]AIH04266.1 pseudouridine synthase [Thermodesulfobacterium commune DSM 2178]KUK37582.1 MAG: tRNA pseudouridine synthase A [Thermodesulfobacterium commune]MBZ4682535.1 pseudouridine synthase [Thermodesulfobacterium sp.]
MAEVNIRNIRLFIAYDGTNYLGWQIQPKGPTVQGVIQEVLSKILGHKVTLKASGRTDAGVHALHQVAHFLTTSDRPLEIIFKALNSLLPKDISVWKVEEVDFKFHAQKHAYKKTYVYQIYNYPIKNPLLRLYSWWVPEPLDLEAMKSCLPLIIGEKDFASFRKAGTEVKTTVRTIYQATLERSLENSNMIVFTIEGRGFMRYMVRNLVGALVEVGKGRLTVEDFENILNAKDRKVAPPPAPPQGLILKKVEYLDVKVLESYPPFEVKI